MQRGCHKREVPLRPAGLAHLSCVERHSAVHPSASRAREPPASLPLLFSSPPCARRTPSRWNALPSLDSSSHLSLPVQKPPVGCNSFWLRITPELVQVSASWEYTGSRSQASNPAFTGAEEGYSSGEQHQLITTVHHSDTQEKEEAGYCSMI